MSWRPLAGFRVGLLGSGRALRFTGRTLATLGAQATRIAPTGVDPPPERDPYHGGDSPREERLSAWLDEGVTVLPATNAKHAIELARDGMESWDIVFHDSGTPALAELDVAERPIVAIALAPEADGLTCGLTAAARAGVAVAVGASDREPLGLPFDLADYTTGLVAAVAGLHATNRGARRADVDAVSVLAAFAGVNGLVYEPYGIPWVRERRRASQCGGPYPYGFWQARDGYVCAIGRSRTDWDRLVEALGRPAWALSGRFDNLRRNGSDHADELDALIAPWSSTQTCAELLEVAQRFGLALAPVRTAGEVLDDPDLRSCGFFATNGGSRVPGPPTVTRSSTARVAPARAAERDPSSFAGARVLDFGWVWSAPMVASGLADMGADVVKVEHPSRPDNSRLRGRPEPGWLEHNDADSLESVPYFLNLNHGKRSIALDLKDPQDAALARRLLERADIVVENLGDSVFRRLGLHYDDIAPQNERLIWLSMATSRCSSQEMRGYAPTISSYSGLESAIGYPDDLTGMMTFGLCDPVAGSWGMLAVLAAWRQRTQTGRGDLLHLGQLEGFLAMLGEQMEQADREGATPPVGNDHPYFHPYDSFLAADGGFVAIAALDDSQRRALARLLDTTTDAETLDRALRKYVTQKSTLEVVAALQGTVACEPVLSYAEVRADPRLRAVGMLSQVDHPLVGCHEVYTQPWKLDGERLPTRCAAPAMGQHSAEVLRDWLELDDSELAERGVDLSSD